MRKGVLYMIGEQIKKLRTARSMSQVGLARMLGVTKQSVSNWENNNILPSIDMLIKIADFFSCTTDYLLEIDDKRKVIEVSDLTLEQIAHIQMIVNDYKQLNTQLKNEAGTRSPADTQK